MQYKYPAIFYFLLVLIIPVIVHLFQLQRFKKIAFTNVQFLKKIRLETRKSSRLKKLLILATRILCFLALLFTKPDTIGFVGYTVDILQYWEKGIWSSSLLEFAYQMMLILVLGHVLVLSCLLYTSDAADE